METVAKKCVEQSNLILGTSSEWRLEIFKELGVTFTQLNHEFDEKSVRKPEPCTLTEVLAKEKANEIIRRLPADFEKHNFFLVTFDQVISVNNIIFEKPQSIPEFKGMMRKYNEAVPCTVSSVHVANLKTGKTLTGCDIVSLQFSEFSEEDIAKSAGRGYWKLCAGGITLGMEPFILNRALTLEQHASAKGVPLKILKEMLQKLGYQGPLL